MANNKQLGNYGERIVAAKLSHPNRGWTVTDLNKGMMNHPRFDLFAFKGDGEPVFIRVKSCAAKDPTKARPVFNIPMGKPTLSNVAVRDFTVFVIMGEAETDEFYVVPTKVVRQTMMETWQDYYDRPHQKHGGQKIDNGMLTLYFHPYYKGEQRPGYDLCRKWSKYRDAWHLLEARQTVTVSAHGALAR